MINNSGVGVGVGVGSSIDYYLGYFDLMHVCIYFEKRDCIIGKIFDSSLARYQNSSSELVEVRLG